MEGTNLLGKSHKQYVQDQIKVRQEKLGKTTKDNNDISWMNSKTSWVRLASSVDIKNSIVGQEVIQGTPLTNEVSINPDLTGSNAFQATPQLTTTTTRNIINSDGEKRLNLLGLDESFMGSTLSQKMVLHGGLEQASFGDTNRLNKKSGVTSKLGTSTASSTSVYTSKNGDFGLVAMPGIQSVDIKSKSMGSLREANLSIRVNDAEQLELIETIYLRLGYSLFLEWGNSSYYSNKGEYVKGASVEPTLLYDFLNPSEKLKKCPTNFIEKIEGQREKSNGNYDALFGRVSNFSWEFDPSGFYNVSLTIISWGDIIESLKIDSLYPGVRITDDKNAVDPKDQSYLNSFIYEASLPNSDTNKIKTTGQNLLSPDQNINQEKVFPTKTTLISKVTETTENYLFSQENKTETQESSQYSKKLNYTRPKELKDMVISGFAHFGSAESNYYYVRFGDLLEFIKRKLLIYLEGCETPITNINTSTNSNYCYNPKINVSADPSKVMIRRTLPVSSEGLENLKLTLSDVKDENKSIDSKSSIFEGVRDSLSVSLEPFDKVISVESGRIDIDTDDDGVIDPKDIPTFKKVTVGLLMNIYFEKQYLYDTINKNRDNKTGRLSLYKFIKDLLDTANDCLGGVNKLDLRVKDDQTLEIYDQTPLYGIKEPEENPAIFNIYGLKKSTGEGSFVTNFGLKTELTNEFATTITVGAQANGSVVGEDATMLSRWNFGLIDRFYPKKLDSLRKENQQSSVNIDLEEFNTSLEKMYNLWTDYSIQRVGGTTNISGDVATTTTTFSSGVYQFPNFNNKAPYIKLQKDFFQSIIKLESKKQKVLSNQIGMLPINLNLEMDGISGIRIYDQIHVDTRFLPSYYPDNLIFIIKGISQSFNGNRWITKIDTIAQPKVQFGKELDLSQNSNFRDNLKEKIDRAAKENVAEVKTREYKGEAPLYKPLANIVERGIDSQGSGAFGAPRGERIHLGVDLVATPGEIVFAPISGFVVADKPAYNNGSKPHLRKITINGQGAYSTYKADLLYAKVDKSLFKGQTVQAGEPVGIMQDMASSYNPGMTNHLHFSLKQDNVPINTEELLPDLL